VAAAVAGRATRLTQRTPAFALMRPPGHHATADAAMGFCYLNQIAIAAIAAQKKFGAAKVAIWDFDAHHGNGTEAILHWPRKRLLRLRPPIPRLPRQRHAGPRAAHP